MEVCLLVDQKPTHDINLELVSLIISENGESVSGAQVVTIGLDNYDFEDGVFLSDYHESEIENIIKKLRNEHGDDYLIGFYSHNSYDNAMVAAEIGADFVAFEYNSEDDMELIDLWDKYTIIPFVVFGKLSEIADKNFSTIAVKYSEFNDL